MEWLDLSLQACNHFCEGTKRYCGVCLRLRVLQRSPARPASSWRCRLSSAPSAPRGATPSAAASASTNGIPCLLDSVAWQPRWKAAPTETAGSAATGLRGGCEEGRNPGGFKNPSRCFLSLDLQLSLAAAGKLPDVQPRRMHRLPHLRRPSEEARLHQL